MSNVGRYAGKNIIAIHPLTISRRGVRRGMAGGYATLERLQEFRSKLFTATRRGTVKVYVQSVMRFSDNAMGSNADSDVLLNISSTAYIVEGRSAIPLVLLNIQGDLDSKIQEMNERSGLVLMGVDAMRMVITRYQPNVGGTYIPLPKELASKKVMINIKNEDNYCFIYCLLLHKHREEIGAKAERPSKYKRYFEEFRQLAGMCAFPLDPDSPDVGRIETIYRLPINIYVLDESGNVAPRRISRTPAMRTAAGQASACNLLLISDGVKSHYVYITRIHALCARGRVRRPIEEVTVTEAPLEEIIAPKVKRQCRRGNEVCDLQREDKETEEEEESSSEDLEVKVGTRNRRFMCLCCMNGFWSEQKLKDHIDGGCGSSEVNCVKEIYPQINDAGEIPTIQWNESRKQALIGKIRVYADFESIMVNEQGYEEVLIDNSSSTRRVSVHKVCSASFYVSAPDSTLDGFEWTMRATQDSHCGDILVTRLIYALFEVVQAAKREIKGFDCLPVFFHNLSGYDGHFLTCALGRIKGSLAHQRKTVIAKNTETFAMISLGPIRFLDSLSLLGPGMGLDTAVKNLTDEGRDFSKFHVTRRRFQECRDETILFKKGEYPYDYFTSVSKFEERALPPATEFRSKLDCEVSRAELEARYQRASRAWVAFGCNTLGEYHDMYLRLDVSLLADVFEAHREMCLAEYGLDPGNGVFVSLPNFSWFAMLKQTGVVLEQITDPDIYQMIERGKRGGQAIITGRHAVANNRYMRDFDRTKPESYITYLDANNLYGLAMSRPLPYAGFRMASALEVAGILEEEERGVWTIKDLPEDQGCFLEVDLEYPRELHDRHNDYPLAPEPLNVKAAMLSRMQCLWLAEMGRFNDTDTDKLCGTLTNKHKYVVHVDLLRFYLAHGLILKHVHRVVMFKQRPWLEPYIRFNTERRAVATTKAAKEFYKLLNNAVFGKTMENVRNRGALQLVNDRKTLLKMVSRPTYKTSTIFRPDDEDGNFLVGVSLHTTTVKLDKPVYAGVSILDLSKLHMYSFHYDQILPRWGSAARLLFTDTDSLCYWIQTTDLYSEMIETGLLEHMDMSETAFDREMCFYNGLLPEEQEAVKENARTNKKVLGKFKDETGGIPIKEFVGLRAKCYSFVTAENHTEQKAKGVNKKALKAYLTHQDYLEILKAARMDSKLATFHSFRSTAHEISTVRVCKQALNKFDDKRFILEDGVTTRAHGHYLNRPGH